MDITFREIREFGECLVLFDQRPSQISLPALGNTYTTICMNLKHAEDVNTMAQAMFLEGEEKGLLGSLNVGEAVVKVQGRIPRPFLVQIPEFQIRKGVVTDDDVKQRMTGVIASFVPLSGSGTSAFLPEQGPPTLADEESALSDLELAFLVDVKTYPESGVAHRYRRLGISVRQGQKLKSRLMSSGLVVESQELTKTGRLNRIRLTEKGECMPSQT